MNLPTQPAAGASKLEHALFLGRLGRTTGAFKIFQCDPDGKDPVYGEMWRVVATWDEAVLALKWNARPLCNIGLAIQPGFIVLDADLYKPGNEAALAAFEKEHGELPRTLEFNSARGGVHLVYATSRNLGNGRGTLPDFGDVRGHGGYIVGPGSTFEGKPYTIERIGVPVSLPTAVDERLRERRSAPPDAKELAPNVTLDDPVNQARFIEFLRRDAQISVEGDHGNDTLAKTGAMGSSYGLSWDATLGLMLEYWNCRCLPPWEDADLEKHGGSGYRSASSQFGNMAQIDGRTLFEPVKAGERPWMDVVRAGDIAGKPAPARVWAMGNDADGWLPAGDVTLLYGPGGAGKTTLVGQIALAFARGEPIWGVPVRRMKVALVDGEDSKDELWRRFEQQGIKASDAVEYVSLVGKDAALHQPFRRGEALTGQPATMLYAGLDQWLTDMGDGEKLLILDNLGQIYEGDYMDPSQIKTFLNVYCRGLLLKHNATGIVVAHPSDAQKLTGEGGFGGITWSANVRSRLYFDYIRDRKGQALGDIRELVRKKANYTAAGTGIPLQWDNWSFVKCDPPKPKIPDRPTRAANENVDPAVADVVRAELGRMMDAFPGKLWSSDRKLAEDLASRLGAAGHEGCGSEYARKILARIRDGGFEHYHVGQGWICQKAQV